MSNKKEKKLTAMQQECQEFAKIRNPDRPVFKNCIKAFFARDLICTFFVVAIIKISFQ